MAFPAGLFTPSYITTFKVIVVMHFHSSVRFWDGEDKCGLRVESSMCVYGADRGRVRSSETDWELIGVEACDMDSLGKHV